MTLILDSLKNVCQIFSRDLRIPASGTVSSLRRPSVMIFCFIRVLSSGTQHVSYVRMYSWIWDHYVIPSTWSIMIWSRFLRASKKPHDMREMALTAADGFLILSSSRNIWISSCFIDSVMRRSWYKLALGWGWGCGILKVSVICSYKFMLLLIKVFLEWEEIMVDILGVGDLPLGVIERLKVCTGLLLVEIWACFALMLAKVFCLR